MDLDTHTQPETLKGLVEESMPHSLPDPEVPFRVFDRAVKALYFVSYTNIMDEGATEAVARLCRRLLALERKWGQLNVPYRRFASSPARNVVHLVSNFVEHAHQCVVSSEIVVSAVLGSLPPTRADTHQSRGSQAQLEADIKRELVSDSNLLKFIHRRRLISRGSNHGQAHRGVVLPVSFFAKQSQGLARGTDRVSTRPQESTEERVRRLSLKATGFDRFKGRLAFFEGPAYKQERAIVSQWLPEIVQVLRSLTGIQWRALQNPKSQGSSSMTAAEAIMKGLGELQKLAKGSSTGITEDKLVCDLMHVRGDKAIGS